LVLSGALGNLYDNLFLDDPHDAHPFGKVRDFIDVYFAAFDWHFPTFNVADSCITVGAILLLYTSLFGKEASS
jgi:signal peptidase II